MIPQFWCNAQVFCLIKDIQPIIVNLNLTFVSPRLLFFFFEICGGKQTTSRCVTAAHRYGVTKTGGKHLRLYVKMLNVAR